MGGKRGGRGEGGGAGYGRKDAERGEKGVRVRGGGAGCSRLCASTGHFAYIGHSFGPVQRQPCRIAQLNKRPG